MSTCGICLAAAIVASAPVPGRFDVTVNTSGQELVIDNPWPEVTPTIYIVGLPDRLAKPVRKTMGVTLAGRRLTETCLSESVLILYPGGTGKWGYNTGFDIFRMPDKVNPRTLVEYDKCRYDPLTRVHVGGGDMNLLMLGNRKRGWPAVYELAFPSGVTITRLKVSSNVSAFSPGDRIALEVFADRALQKRVAGHEIIHGKKPYFPVTLDGLSHARLYLRLASLGAGKHSINLYYTRFEADLDTSGLELPVLKQGRNTWQYTDDADSSHAARIVLKWHRKPAGERIWEDFEGKRSPFGPATIVGPRGGKVGAFTGKQFARITFVHDGKDRQAYRGFSKPVDLTAYDRMSIAVRTPVRRGLGQVLFGIRNEGGSNQYLRPRAGQHWRLLDFDIRAFKRDRVKSMTVYFLQRLAHARPGQAITYDVDTICFYKGEPPKPKAAPELPTHVLKHKSPDAGKTARARAIPPVREWFPMGVYSGYPDRRAWPFMLDDLKRHHMNTIYVSNGSLENLEAILPMAEARGIRLVHQGTSPGSLYYLHYSNPEARRHMYERGIVPTAKEWVPKFVGRWGVVGWSLTEEIGPDTARELGPYYTLVRQLDPTHPPTVLHNNRNAAEVDLKQNRPPFVTHDFYPYFWAPTSGPSNPHRSIAAYRGHVAGYYKACRQHGASLWMMPQSFGTRVEATLDPPYFGYRRGMRQPEPGEIKLQGWVAIAEGATGLTYYHYRSNNPSVTALRTHDWQPTPLLEAMGELFARVTRVAPLLCRLERDYKEQGLVKVTAGSAIAHTFVKRKGYAGAARYVVVASLDGFKAQTVRLTIGSGAAGFDMVSRRSVSGPTVTLELGPGMGTVLGVGRRADVEADWQLVDRELAAWR